MWDASGSISEHSISVVHCFTLSHTHTLTESHTGPPCMSPCTAYLTRNIVYKTRSSSCFIDFLIPTSDLTDLILNSMQSSRSSSDSVVTGLGSNRKIAVWFPECTRDNSVLNFSKQSLSYRVPGIASQGLKRLGCDASHHLAPRVQREHAIMPKFSVLPRRAA